MTNKENILSLHNISFSYGENKILKEIGLEVTEGELIGLIGPNGAGKTTLLKSINKINSVTGKIKIKGKDIESIKEKELAREIAIMHQNTNLEFPLPSIDVVLMGRYPYLKRTQGEGKNDYAIARKNMEYTKTMEFEHKPITQVSGGERQRILFAKVLTQETDLILLDEPTASLDITHQEQIFKYCSELTKEGKTVIAAIHDLKVACKFCSKLVLLKEGNVIAYGTPEEVMTSENLSRAYDVNAVVYRNKVTGLLDFYIYGKKHSNGKSAHVIGGGGSATEIIRYLFENGYHITTGVISEQDSDYHTAEIFGIESVTSNPFSKISDEAFKNNIEKVKSAKKTFLCNMPFGEQNMRNLEAAMYAKELIIVEDIEAKYRDYTEGEAIKLYEKLKEKAMVITSSSLHEVI